MEKLVNRVMLLAGRSCAGKTALILNLAMNIARNDSVPVAIFSPDHSAAQLVLKIFNQNGIDSSKFCDTSKLLMEDLSNISKVEDAIKGLPLFIDDTRFQTLQEFACKVGWLVNKEGVKVVFIDRMEFFERPASLALVEQKALALQTLRQLADRLSITIVACERLRGIPDSQPIDLNEFESKGLPYEILKEYVDVAAVLNRPGVNVKDGGEHSAEIMILHNRNGVRDISLGLQFIPELYSFQDVLTEE